MKNVWKNKKSGNTHICFLSAKMTTLFRKYTGNYLKVKGNKTSYRIFKRHGKF